jgi:predicted ATP-grasp superfamily ATP-dependent carboligase
VTDECIHPLAHARERFAGLTRLALPDDSALDAVSDKSTTVEIARSLGVPVPETRIVLSRDDGRRAADELGFPVVLKPSVSRLYEPDEDRIHKGAVCFARDVSELERRLEELLPRHVVLAQRYRPGVGVGVEALARDGRVLLAFQHRRLAEIPVTGGASAWRESAALQPELLDYTRRLVEALRWTGLIMVEFKVGSSPCLMEINGRVWGSLPLSRRAGIDFPRALAALYFPETGTPGGEGAYPVGLRSYNLELLLSWIGQTLLGRARDSGLPHPRRRRAFAGLAGLLDPTQKSDLSGDGDFAPRLAEADRIGRRLAKLLLGRGGRR